MQGFLFSQSDTENQYKNKSNGELKCIVRMYLLPDFITRLLEFLSCVEEEPFSFSKKLWLTKIVVIKQTWRRQINI